MPFIESTLLNLDRPARKKGADRYQGILGDEREWKVYIPQSLSRRDGQPPLKTLYLLLQDEKPQKACP